MTGIRTRPATQEYRDGWDRAFGKERPPTVKPGHNPFPDVWPTCGCGRAMPHGRERCDVCVMAEDAR